MEENKQLQEHIKAIGEWASEDKKRVAFVVCGEMTDDGVKTANSLVGRTDKIARALFGNAMNNSGFKQVITLAAGMAENPLVAAILCSEASKDEESVESKPDFADALIGLLDALKNKIKND